MKNTLVLLISTLFLLLSGSVLAQGPEGVEMADVMRSNGKIYVVVAVDNSLSH